MDTAMSTSSTANNTKTFPRFRDFPREIRDLVYKEILTDTPITYEPVQTSKMTYKRTTHRTNTTSNFIVAEEDDVLADLPAHAQNAIMKKAGNNGYAIFLASQAISHEFLHQAYYHTTFTFQLSTPVTATWKRYDISPAVLSRIHHLRFVKDCSTDSAETAVDKERELHLKGVVGLGQCPALRTLEIELVLSEELTKDEGVKKCQNWVWKDTVAGEIGVNNIWKVPRSDWLKLWIV